MLITFDQFKSACRFNAANGFRRSDGGVYFPDGPKCHHGELKKACFMKRCPMLKPKRDPNTVQVVGAKANRFLGEEKRVEYLRAQAGRVKACREAQLHALYLELATEMKALRLYSETTYIHDIARGVGKRIAQLNLR